MVQIHYLRLEFGKFWCVGGLKYDKDGSQICKIFNGFCFIKEFVGGDQLIMNCMIKMCFILL